MIPRNRSRALGRRAEQRLDKPDQARERRLQLVPGIGDEIRAHLLGKFEGGDVVQRHDRGDAAERNAFYPRDARLHDALDRQRQREIDNPCGPAGEHRVGRIQDHRVAQ